MTEQPERLSLTSMSITEDRIAKLREDFPEVFREGKVDVEALQRSLGEWVDPGKERFGLTWPGKADCMRVIQAPATGALVPMREESVDFDTTRNVIIEGENLEVLKLLQKSYAGKVKMIYIDPPYNTGNEFIYPDNFREGLDDYLKYSGQVDSEGFKTSSNTETGGRYHSKWLSMMYPRLFLARNLLRDDGVIFVSIDDHEIQNLLALMNEIFGEENFVSTVIWQKKQSPQRDATYFSNMHDFILSYARYARAGRNESSGLMLNLLTRNTEQELRYRNVDDDPRGVWASVDCTINKTASERPNLYYGLVNPNTGEEVWPSRRRVWTFEKPRMEQLRDENRLWWGANGTNFPRLKSFLSEVQEGVVPSSIWLRGEVGDNQEATRTFRALFSEADVVFDSPKPVRMIQRMIELSTQSDGCDLVLDFFAGSGTTAHAVAAQNIADGGNRRYILVQLPEPIVGEYTNITEITRERVRRAGQAIAAEQPVRLVSQHPAPSTQHPAPSTQHPAPLDLGFRAYRLTSSNFKSWKSDPDQIENIVTQLELYADNVVDGRTSEDILTELLLATGFELTTPVERLSLAGLEVFSVAEGALLVCLERRLTLAVIEAMAARDPAQIICLDAGFQGNDQLKVNANQIIKTRTREGHEPIVFKVV